jgi:hypothetical protein
LNCHSTTIGNAHVTQEQECKQAIKPYAIHKRKNQSRHKGRIALLDARLGPYKKKGKKRDWKWN